MRSSTSRGVDFVFVGPDDLAISLGHEPTTEPTEPAVVEAIERVLQAAASVRLPAGIYCGSAEMVQRWGSAGFRILAVTSDTALLAQSTQAALRAARDSLVTSPSVRGEASRPPLAG